jgi:hypothetical protein
LGATGGNMNRTIELGIKAGIVIKDGEHIREHLTIEGMERFRKMCIEEYIKDVATKAADVAREVFDDSCEHTHQAIDYMEQLLLNSKT